MASLMQLEVLAPDKYVFKADDVSYVEVVAVDGALGILPRHATMIAALTEAPLMYRDEQGGPHYICLDGGFLEVKNNRVTILSVAAETAESIDIKRAKAALERAKAKLDSKDKEIDVPTVIRSLHRAEARLKTVRLAAKG